METLYIVPVSAISPIYYLSHILCWILISLIILFSLLDVKGLSKSILSSISILSVIIHYYIVSMLSRFESISIFPLVIIESTSKGSVFYIDYGQIIILLLLYMYREKILKYIGRIYSRII